MKLHRSISSKYSILAAISFSESLILLLTRTLCSRCIGKWVPKKHSLPQIKSFEEGKCIGQIKNISCQFRIIAQIGSKFEWKHTVDLYTICMGSLHQHSNWRWSPPPQPIFSDDAGTQESLSFSYPPKSCDLVDIWKSATYVGDIYIYVYRTQHSPSLSTDKVWGFRISNSTATNQRHLEVAFPISSIPPSWSYRMRDKQTKHLSQPTFSGLKVNVPKSWSSRSSFLKGDSCGDGSCHFKDLYKRKMNIPMEYLDWSWCFHRLKWKFIKNTFSCAMPGWTDASHPTRPKKDGEGDGDRAGESQSHSEVPKKPKGWPSKISYSSVKFPTFYDSPCEDNLWSLIQLFQ